MIIHGIILAAPGFQILEYQFFHSVIDYRWHKHSHFEV